jgi:hypothetical protein
MVLMPGNPNKYWSPDIARDNSISSFLQMRDAATNRDYNVKPLPQYDYAKQADRYAQQAANINVQSSQNAVQNAAGTVFGSAGMGGGGGGNLPTGRLGAVLRALRAQESGGNYGVSNGSSGAAGAYQVMPANFVGSGGWDQAAIGRDIGLQYFLSHPRVQDAIARHIFGGYMNKYGVRGALASWYSGQPNWRNDAPQSGGPSIHDYVMQVLARL